MQFKSLLNLGLSLYHAESDLVVKFPQSDLIAVISQSFFCRGKIYPFKASMFVGKRDILTLHLDRKAMLGDNETIFSPNRSGILKTLCGDAAFRFQFRKAHSRRYPCFLKGFPSCRYKRCSVLIFSAACDKLPASISLLLKIQYKISLPLF